MKVQKLGILNCDNKEGTTTAIGTPNHPSDDKEKDNDDYEELENVAVEIDMEDD